MFPHPHTPTKRLEIGIESSDVECNKPKDFEHQGMIRSKRWLKTYTAYVL